MFFLFIFFYLYNSFSSVEHKRRYKNNVLVATLISIDISQNILFMFHRGKKGQRFGETSRWENDDKMFISLKSSNCFTLKEFKLLDVLDQISYRCAKLSANEKCLASNVQYK